MYGNGRDYNIPKCEGPIDPPPKPRPPNPSDCPIL